MCLVEAGNLCLTAGGLALIIAGYIKVRRIELRDAYRWYELERRREEREPPAGRPGLHS